MVKNRPNTIRSSSNNTRSIFREFLKILLGNIIELDKGYKSIYLFPNSVNVKEIYKSLKLGTF